jgi:hypothetical protein
MATIYGSPTFKAFVWTDESNIPGHGHEEAKDMKSAEETKAFVLRYSPQLGLVSRLQSNWPVIRNARDRFDARKQSAKVDGRPTPARALRA